MSDEELRHAAKWLLLWLKSKPAEVLDRGPAGEHIEDVCTGLLDLLAENVRLTRERDGLRAVVLELLASGNELPCPDTAAGELWGMAVSRAESALAAG